MTQLNIDKISAELAEKYAAIPAELKAIPNWVVATDQKIPVNPISGYYAKTNDSTTWSSFDNAVSFLSQHYNEEIISKKKSSEGVVPRYTGIGFVFDDNKGLVGIDIDHCLDDNGNIIEKAVQEIVDKTDSYIEKSKSNHGLHIIVKGNKVGKDCRQPVSDTIGIEMYNEGRYFYITGNLYEKSRKTIAVGQNLINYVTDKYLNSSNKTNEPKVNDCLAESIDIDDNVEIPDIIWADIASLCSKNKRFGESWNGERFESCDENGELRHDESGQDFYLLCNLAPIVNYNPAVLKNVFLKSPYVDSKDRKHKEKLKRKDYIDNSIINAISAARRNSKETAAELPKQHNNDNLADDNVSGQTEFCSECRVLSEEDEELLEYGFTDIDNADRFLNVYRNRIMYCTDDNCWYVYNGKIWIKDKSKSLLRRMAKELYHRMNTISKANLDSLKNLYASIYCDETVKAEAICKAVKKLGSVATQNAMFSAAESDVAVTQSEIISERYLLPVNNGIVNLKTGELLDFSPDYKFTQCMDIDYNPDAGEAKRFLQFLDEIFCGDKALVEYVLAFLGYCITGEVKESKFLVCHGSGGNGKSVLFNLIKKIFGGFADCMNKGSILKKTNSDGPNSGLMKVRNARYVQVNELNKNDVLDTSLIKTLTGGDGETISARDLYCSEQSFEVQFKLIVNTNFLPKLNWFDYAIARRVLVVPFMRTFKDDERDLDLPKKLEAEKEKILALLVQGAVEYYANGLPEVPAACKKAYNDALIEDAPLNAFFEEKVEITGDAEDVIGGAHFYEEVKTWCHKKGVPVENVPSQTAVGLVVKKMPGIVVRENSYHITSYVGLLIKPEDKSTEIQN